jgi:hypothetical protein
MFAWWACVRLKERETHTEKTEIQRDRMRKIEKERGII